MKRIIITRFSAMGDVAMLASVLKEFQQQHLDTELVVVSRPLFTAFFEHIPRLIFHEIHPKTKHKGLQGLFKLYKELSVYNAQFVADMHNNLRSRVLRVFFSFSGKQIKSLDKGRWEKKALVQHKIFHQLALTTERYADVLRQLGFPFSLPHLLVKEQRNVSDVYKEVFEQSNKTIGIAPFAQHLYKVWSLQKMEQLVEVLSKKGYDIFLFGGGNKEKSIAEAWSAKYPKVNNTIGKFSVSEELDIIANLNVMLSMDSSGMHMASLVGTRCVSIWGATHPFAGFLGYGQNYNDCIQVEHPNRPSSIYGNKPCLCDNVEAIDLVTVDMVVNHIEKICE